ncbi:MAG: GAF domain-containing protein [Saccharospirillum sp.]
MLAETTAEHLEPRFLGQHFPASDIPAQARALYRENLLRLIADVQATPVGLCNHTETTRPLDLSHALLRSPSPFHRTYLKNMGIRATLTLSILVKGELWGLLTCHNS